MQYLLQKYEDGLFGYLCIDGDEQHNFATGAKVICQQASNESREDFIKNNHIVFENKQYGSNLELDRIINEGEIGNGYMAECLAQQGYGLDKLIRYPFLCVRREVIRQRYGLDIFIHDDDPYMRAAVARQGYGLDILINDPDSYVRQVVAEQGYGLDILENDSDVCVKRTAIEKKYGFSDVLSLDHFRNLSYKTIEKWIASGKNTNVCTIDNKQFDLDIFIYYLYLCTRVIRGWYNCGTKLLKLFDMCGYDLRPFNDAGANSLRIAAFTLDCIDKYINDVDPTCRRLADKKFAELDDNEKDAVITRNINKICSYESDFAYIISYAIEHNIELKYIFKHIKSDTGRWKILYKLEDIGVITIHNKSWFE